ncbi:sulfotransferase domain-containing protein [Nitrospirillum sp. BR 11163]|uniref:sulfotransferase domain-containing protein n=1 Tax=Nitrospirillum sp. BR 11163 TaxID=3104323 RepID=UPI002AFE8629|nr:sulfotransferase domain-containing protein [Nitrospirillum sp. BR 11163]MEA1675115.1 sulfotransferase domain-containing protein [Nitrospirillum sp. BR 11163]
MRQLLSHALGESGFESGYANDLAHYVGIGEKAKVPVVLKTHHPDTMMQLRIAHEDIPTIITLRDPRDCVASLMRRFDQPFNEAFAYVLRSVRRVQSCVAQGRRTLVFRYEDGFHDQPESVGRIADFIGMTAQDAALRAIHEGLLTHTVKRTLAQLEDTGRFVENAGTEVNPNLYDPVTHWHRTHIGDGAVGKYRTLPDRARALMDNAFWSFLAAYYLPPDAPVPAGIPAEVPDGA